MNVLVLVASIVGIVAVGVAGVSGRMDRSRPRLHQSNRGDETKPSPERVTRRIGGAVFIVGGVAFILALRRCWWRATLAR